MADNTMEKVLLHDSGPLFSKWMLNSLKEVYDGSDLKTYLLMRW